MTCTTSCGSSAAISRRSTSRRPWEGTMVDVKVVSAYGTSATGAADHFTYGTTIVSGDPPPSVDPAIFDFAAATYSLRESGGAAQVTVTRSGNVDVAATVSYATANGTAVAGFDYRAASGTLKFAAGETTKTFSVGIVDDTLREASE